MPMKWSLENIDNDAILTQLLSENATDSKSTDCFFEPSASGQIPFPQADSLERILAVIDAIPETGIELARFVVYGIVNNERQAGYYANAAMFLNCCYKRGDFYYPTDRGLRIKKTDGSLRRRVFALEILAIPDLKKIYEAISKFETDAQKKEFVGESIVPKNLGEATRKRRASTIVSWMNWIRQQLT